MLRAQKNLKGLSIVFYCLLSVHAMLHDDVPSTTDQCGARSGSPQLLLFAKCFITFKLQLKLLASNQMFITFKLQLKLLASNQ